MGAHRTADRARRLSTLVGRQIGFGFLLAMTVISLSLAVCPSASAGPANIDLTLANSYLNLHLLQQAEEVYVDVLTPDSKLKEARVGLASVLAERMAAQRHFAFGRINQAEGRPRAAAEQYRMALVADPSWQGAQEALSALMVNDQLGLASFFEKLHLLQRAEACYRAALGVDGQFARARRGLEKVVRARLQADALLAQGQALQAEDVTNRAETRFIETLQIDRSNGVAVAALTTMFALNAPAHPFARAIALANAGYDQAAANEVQRVLRAWPGVTVPPILKNAQLQNSAKGLVGQVDNLWNRFFPWDLAAAILLVGLCLAIGAMRRKSLAIDPFIGAEDLSSTAMAPMLHDEMARLAGSEENGRARLIPSPPDHVELPAAVDSLPGLLKPFVAILWLFGMRRHVWHLSGSLESDEERGVGVTMLLRDSYGNLDKSVTLWESTYLPGGSIQKQQGAGDPSGFIHLVPPAASWLLAAWSDQRILGTRSWESLALFDSGAAWQLEGNPQWADTLYRRALDKDPNNRGALLNLGQLESENRHDEEAARLLDRLGGLLEDAHAADHKRKMPNRRRERERLRTRGRRFLWLKTYCVLTARWADYLLGKRDEPTRAQVRDSLGGDEQDLLWLRTEYALAALWANRYLCVRCKEPCDFAMDRTVDESDARNKAMSYAGRLLLRAAVLQSSPPRDETNPILDVANVTETGALCILADVLDGSTLPEKVTPEEARLRVEEDDARLGAKPTAQANGHTGDLPRAALVSHLLDGTLSGEDVRTFLMAKYPDDEPLRSRSAGFRSPTNWFSSSAYYHRRRRGVRSRPHES